MKEHVVTLTEGERRKLLAFARNEEQKLFRSGKNHSAMTFAGRAALVKKLELKGG